MLVELARAQGHPVDASQHPVADELHSIAMQRENVLGQQRKRLLAILAPFPVNTGRFRDDVGRQQPGVSAISCQSATTKGTGWAPGPDLVTKMDIGLARKANNA
jgi:hypothetical protein